MPFVFSTEDIISIITGASSAMSGLISTHGYFAIILILSLEYASLPIPSEVVLPLIGLFVYHGKLNIWLAILSTTIGTFIGITFDYYLAYFFGKKVLYSNAKLFRIKKESLEEFERWFNHNFAFTVFAARLLPIVRGPISFPAGFAKMDLKRFYLYSLSGSMIWNISLIEFGYYAIGTNDNIVLTAAFFALFAQAFYIIYKKAMKEIDKETGMKLKE